MKIHEFEQAKDIYKEIERVKQELAALSVPFKKVFFSEKKKHYLLNSDKLPVIELNMEQLKYLYGLKQQELRNLEKELDEL